MTFTKMVRILIFIMLVNIQRLTLADNIIVHFPAYIRYEDYLSLVSDILSDKSKR